MLGYCLMVNMVGTKSLLLMTAAKEDVLHDTDNLKRHWVKTLCNGIKKPTGGTGEKGERIHKCIAIERLILDKTHSGILGLLLDGDADSKDGCSGSGSDTSFNKYSTKVVPSPPPPVEDTTGKNKMMRKIIGWDQISLD